MSKTYKVTVEEILEDSGDKKYPIRTTIYEQTFTSEKGTEVQNIIKSVNNIAVTY